VSAGASEFDSACSRTNDRFERAAGRDARADGIELVGDLERVACGGAVIQQIERQRGRAGLLGGVGRVARVHCEGHVDERARMPLEQHHLQAVTEGGALHFRKRDVGRLAERRHDGAIEARLPRLERGVRRHQQGVRRRLQPLLTRGADLGAGRRGHALQPLEVSVRTAVERHALGQDVGSSAETTEPLGAAREVGLDAAARALQFRLGRPLLQEFVHHGVHLAFDAVRVDAVLHGGRDHEQARE
jgi:hypothetical protein